MTARAQSPLLMAALLSALLAALLLAWSPGVSAQSAELNGDMIDPVDPDEGPATAYYRWIDGSGRIQYTDFEPVGVPSELIPLTPEVDEDAPMLSVSTAETPSDPFNDQDQQVVPIEHIGPCADARRQLGILHAALPDHDVRAGMVPFNVVPSGPGRFHRATSGEIIVESGPGELRRVLSSTDLPVVESDDIDSVQWGKLVINLNNALNALSGLTLKQQLLDRSWRRLMADQMDEALAVLKAAGHPVASTTPLPAWMTPHILRLPTPLFSRIAARMIRIDPSARTSMAYDVQAGRETEIDSLQGEIIRLGEKSGVQTPICQRVRTLIEQGRELRNEIDKANT